MSSPVETLFHMLRIFMQGGPLMWPIVLIAMVLIGLAIHTALGIRRGGANTSLVQNGLDGLLFWGVFAAILGVLGQVSGHYRGFSAVVAHGLVSPRALWIGTAECMVSTITGLSVLSLAGVLWFLLRRRFHRTRPIGR